MLRDTVLQEAVNLVKTEGLADFNEQNILVRLDISQATFKELFSGMEDMVNKVVMYDLENQKKEHAKAFAHSKNAVEDIMFLLQDGIESVKKTNPVYYKQLQEKYPKAWAISLEHLNSYSYPQVHDVINRGVLEGSFRRDVNIQLVTKIILEQLNMMLNPAIFPPERYNLAEVFRSIYLYYVRGICTESGSKLAEEYFTRNRL